MQRPVIDEPLNTFHNSRTALSPFPKRNSFLCCSNSQRQSFVTSCYLQMHHLDMIWFCSNMNLLFMVFRGYCALFTYNILPSELLNGILFIKQYFQIKINNLHVHSIIPEAWNIQACKCLTGTVTYTWWSWRGRRLKCSGILHNVCMTDKLTRCVTFKVYWNVHVPCLRAQQKIMQSQIFYEIFIMNRY